MIKGFWSKLKKPIIIQAPMADVTDAAFRRIIAKYSRPTGPDVFYTEFISADGLYHSEARQKLLLDLKYTEAERPIVAQIFSGRPEKIRQAAKLIVELGFDGLDINMGCPDRSVEKQGAGAALIKDPARAQAIIQAAKDGVAETGRPIPVSVKTRVGYSKISELENWLQTLIKVEPAAITFHLRIRKEMSKVSAHWDLLPAIVTAAAGSGVLIFGNGDIDDVSTAKQMAQKTGADGIMIGRGIFGNPWLYSNRSEVPVFERLKAVAEHAELFEQLFNSAKSFAIMKKHFRAYAGGFNGAAGLRAKLMAAETAAEVRQIINGFLS